MKKMIAATLSVLCLTALSCSVDRRIPAFVQSDCCDSFCFRRVKKEWPDLNSRMQFWSSIVECGCLHGLTKDQILKILGPADHPSLEDYYLMEDIRIDGKSTGGMLHMEYRDGILCRIDGEWSCS